MKEYNRDDEVIKHLKRDAKKRRKDFLDDDNQITWLDIVIVGTVIIAAVIIAAEVIN